MKGSTAELFAKVVFMFMGYRVVASNYKTGRGTHAGEIDFIATRFNTIVFVEVKKRKNINYAMQAISEKQKQRILNGLKGYLKYHPEYSKFDKRIDGFFVQNWIKFRHVKGVFDFSSLQR